MQVAIQKLELVDIRARIDELLNRLGASLIARMEDEGEVRPDRQTRQLQAQVALLGQLAAGLAVVDAECLPARGAGFGSRVQLRNLATGELEEYLLMVGSLVDIDAGQVSLASPIGQALIGRGVGDEITIATPQRQVRMRITRLTTLLELLDPADLPPAA